MVIERVAELPGGVEPKSVLEITELPEAEPELALEGVVELPEGATPRVVLEGVAELPEGTGLRVILEEATELPEGTE